jgi:segregation and condensation protein B
MTWREIWQSTVSNLKALLGISPPPAPPPSIPAPKRKPRALTGPVINSGTDSIEHSPQTIDLTPLRAMPPPSSPLRTRKEPKVPAHIAREVAAFASANQHRSEHPSEDKYALPAAIADMVRTSQGIPQVAQIEMGTTPIRSDAFDPDDREPSRDSNNYTGNHPGNHHSSYDENARDNHDGDLGDNHLGDNEDDSQDDNDEGVALTTLLESLLFVAAEPVAPIQLAKTLELSLEVIEQGLAELADYYQRSLRGLRLQRFNGKVQLVTASAAAPFIEIFLNLDNSTRLSAPALETLAVIAYRQPVTRAQIEAVRGVDCAGVLRTLVQRGLVADVGRMEGVGRPILYGVTELFMQHFGLMEMAELPPLEETEADQLWAATVLEEQELDDPQLDKPSQAERK